MKYSLKHKESEKQFVELIHEHEGIIHKVIGLYIDGHEDKKDAYQEILCQSWKGYSRFAGNSKFSTWLYKVALHTVLNFQKKKRTTPVDLPVEQNEEKSEAHEKLYLIIKRLDEIDRMLITLHLDGYSNKEIAEISGMTSNHINVKLHRIKKTIADKFKTDQS